MHALGLDEDPDARDAARRLVHSDRAQAVLSFAAAGELVGLLHGPRFLDRAQEGLDRIHSWLRDGAIRLFGFGGADHEVPRMALELARQEPRIKPGDALVIASSIADPGAEGLVSTDEFVTYQAVRHMAR